MASLATDASPASVNEETPVVVDTSATEGDANAAASSTVDEQDAKEPENLLDVVKSAVQPEQQAEASSSPEEKQEAPNAEAGAEEAADDAASEADVPFHNHPRWKELQGERKELQAQLEAVQPELQRIREIDTFVQANGLLPEEVGEGFQIMAALKARDPETLPAVREWFAQNLATIDGWLGYALPDDLQEKVNEGYLDEEGAQEIAQARAAQSLRQDRDARATERDTQLRAAQEAEAHRTSVMTAVQGWEDRTKASDPDYSKKAELVQAKSLAIIQRNGKAPQTADEAVAIAEQALAEVNALLKPALPKARPITPSPLGSSTPAINQPKTLKDAIRNAVASH